MSQSHNVNYNHTTACNRGVISPQENPDGDDDSILTSNGSSSITGDSHGSRLYSCWVWGQNATYHDTALKLLVEAGMNQTHIHCIAT